MAKQNQATKAQPDKKSRSKVEPTVVEELTDDLAGLAELPGGPIGAFGGGSIQAQAAQLGDGWLQVAQRRALAAQIGRVQGNQYLQRVVAFSKPAERTGQHAPRTREGRKLVARELTRTIQQRDGLVLQRQRAPEDKPTEEDYARRIFPEIYRGRGRRRIKKSIKEELGKPDVGKALKWWNCLLADDEAECIEADDPSLTGGCYFNETVGAYVFPKLDTVDPEGAAIEILNFEEVHPPCPFFTEFYQTELREYIDRLQRQTTSEGKPIEEAEFTAEEARKEVVVSNFDIEMLDPKLAAEVDTRLPVIRKSLWTIKNVIEFYNQVYEDRLDEAIEHLDKSDEILKGKTLPAALEHSKSILSATEAVLTVTDPDERKKWLDKLTKYGAGAGLTGILAFAAKATADAVSLSMVFAYGMARITRNKKIMKEATKYLARSAKFLGRIAPAIEALNFAHDVFVLASSEASAKEKEEAAVGAGEAALAVAGAWPVAVALEITYQEVKWLVNKYGKAVVDLTSNVLSRAYEQMREDGNRIAKPLLVTEQLLFRAIDAQAGNSPKTHGYLLALHRSFPPLQGAILNAEVNFTRDQKDNPGHFSSMREAFKRGIDQRALDMIKILSEGQVDDRLAEYRTIDYAWPLVSIGRSILAIMRKLYVNRNSILEEEAKTAMNQYKKGSWF